MQDPVRVVVADDHPVILFGAEQALLKFPGLQVVARATVNRTGEGAANR
ncbi:UNVERIFIED_ORG: DNA-binding NarL/FixJ family response regulator [Paraburkholderia sediminicola]|nr:DNA-binding NarL/FixJ family response regulator [Paraburkholderia sediminicola]